MIVWQSDFDKLIFSDKDFFQKFSLLCVNANISFIISLTNLWPKKHCSSERAFKPKDSFLVTMLISRLIQGTFRRKILLIVEKISV